MKPSRDVFGAGFRRGRSELLMPLGRSVLEMAWFGSIALTSFAGTKMKAHVVVCVHHCSLQRGPNVTCYKIVGVAGQVLSVCRDFPMCMLKWACI